MAGIGVKLNKIYEKNTLTSDLYGFVYSTFVTIGPMLMVMAAVVLTRYLLGFSALGYAQRRLYSCTVLYLFVFAFLVAAPFGPVLSRYLSDTLYEERYGDILPCFYLGGLLMLFTGCCLGASFCLHEYFVGEVPVYYVFTGFCGYMSLILAVHGMTFLSITKDYKRISHIFFAGMLLAVILSAVLCYWLEMEGSYSALLGLTVGFFIIGALEYGQIRHFFPENSGEYRLPLGYFGRYWKLMLTNLFYVLGLYVHNFVFWTTDLGAVVAKSFLCAEPYDVATCAAMLTNIASSIILVSRIEMKFRSRYKAHTEAVIGGRWMDIQITQKRMFRQISDELFNLVRVQFILSVILYLLMALLMPRMGYGGLAMDFYHCLAAGYFPLFLMYAAILFLFYFNDLSGALMVSVLFCGTVWAGTLVCVHLPHIWGGLGVFTGSVAAFVAAYFRLRWTERNFDRHIFCTGRLLKPAVGVRPSGKVLDRRGGIDEIRLVVPE